jgi:hypothetical protein
MSEDDLKKSLFDQKGRRVNTNAYRVFQPEGLDYYHIKNQDIDYDQIVYNYKTVDFSAELKVESFQKQCERLKKQIAADSILSGLLHGVHIPFLVPRQDKNIDLAATVFGRNLLCLEKSFTTRFPGAKFKSILQGGTKLESNLKIASNSRYDELLKASLNGAVLGWYFPQALQQYDVASQTRQMEELPTGLSICLSGPLEIFSANIGKPDLLINERGYSPILCMSGVEHYDERLVLVLKAYGPHLEFWCMSQMLTPDTKQVSEQWAGGISIFEVCII